MLRSGFLALLVLATPAAAAAQGVCVENATIGELSDALAGGRIAVGELVSAYLARIEAYDRAGPSLDAVREINPDAAAIAARLDAARGGRSKASRFSSRTTSRPATPSTPPRARLRSPTRTRGTTQRW